MRAPSAVSSDPYQFFILFDSMGEKKTPWKKQGTNQSLTLKKGPMEINLEMF